MGTTEVDMQAHAAVPAEPARHVIRVPRDVSQYVRENGLTAVDGWRSTRRFLSGAAAYVIALLVGLRADALAVWLPVWMFQGLVLLGCAAAWHEGVHGLLYRNKRVNHLVGALAGGVLIFPASAYRYAHLEHHRQTNTESDPETLPPYRNVFQYVLLQPLSGVIYVGFLWWESIKAAVGKPPVWLRTPESRRHVKANLAFMVALVCGLVYTAVQEPRLMFFVYGAPLLLCITWYVGMVTLPEHYGCAKGPGAAFQTTRSTTSNVVFRWFFWGTNFHAAHHLYPSVPAPRLAQLQDYIEARCDNTEPSYLRWHAHLIADLAARRPQVIDLVDAVPSD